MKTHHRMTCNFVMKFKMESSKHDISTPKQISNLKSDECDQQQKVEFPNPSFHKRNNPVVS